MCDINFSKLTEPFAENEIEWRLQSCGESNGKIWGKCLAYVTNRAIQTRLDEVCGPQNWKNEYDKAPDGGILCGISIKCDGEWITKYDGAENTQVEAVKGGLSDSMKRAAVQWGMGRYLYNLDEGWADVSDKGKYRGCTKDKKYFSWNPPKLPVWALPKEEAKQNVRNEAKQQLDEKKFSDIEGKLIEYMDMNILNETEINSAKNAIANKNIVMMEKILACCVNRNSHKQGA